MKSTKMKYLEILYKLNRYALMNQIFNYRIHMLQKWIFRHSQLFNAKGDVSNVLRSAARRIVTVFGD